MPKGVYLKAIMDFLCCFFFFSFFLSGNELCRTGTMKKSLIKLTGITRRLSLRGGGREKRSRYMGKVAEGIKGGRKGGLEKTERVG